MKMKKSILLLLILLGTLGLNAQDFGFGLVAGLDVANTRITNIPSSYDGNRPYHPLIAFNINAHINFKSKSFWAVSIEPGFIQKGELIRYDDDDKNKDVRIINNYIQVPVFVDFFPTKRLSLSVGPEFAVMLNAKAKSKDDSNDISDMYDEKFEISAIVGINYNVIKYIDIGLRYSRGLTHILAFSFIDETGTTIGDGKMYNQYFQFFVRFKIRTGGN